jgi:hypothetical protein
MFTSMILLRHQCLEENGGAEASQRSFGILYALATRKIAENCLAHLFHNTKNLAVLGR